MDGFGEKVSNTDFWNEILEQSSFDEFMKNNSDFWQTGDSSLEPRQAENVSANRYLHNR